MNTRHYLRLLRTFALAALTAAATAACSDDIDNDREPLTPPDDNGGIPVTFTANINPGSDAAPAAAPDTRTILTPTTEGGFTVMWKGKDSPDGTDRILIWAAKDNTLTSQSAITYVPITSDVSSDLMPRDDRYPLTVPSTGEWKFTAVYGEYGSGNGTADAMVSPLTQSAPGDTKHIARYDFSIATATKIVGAGEMPANINFTFHHLLSAMQLHVTNETGAELTVKEIRLSAAGGQIAYYRAYNVVAGGWKADGEQKRDYLQLTADNFPALATGGASQDLYMLFFPGYANTDMTITVITDRGEFTLTKTAPASPGFEAGKNYMTNIAIKSSGLTDKETWTEIISTPEQLAAFRNRVNNGSNYDGMTVRLAANIDLASASWTPIGTSQNPFRGTFDGGKYHINGLNVDNGSKDFAGLFGYIRGGSVRNLRVSGNVTTTGSDAGGIAGFFSSSGIIENCIFSGEVSGKEYVGGIAGYCYGNYRIAGCHTKGRVTATEHYAGGIAGGNSNNCTLTDCYSEAEVYSSIGGGITGANSGTVTRCYATGQVSGKKNVGGIVGQLYAGTVNGCIALNSGLTRTEGDKTTFGRIVGYKQQSGTVTNCAAFSGMTIKDATSNATITSGATSVAGDDLTREQCVTGATYSVNYGIAWASGWNAGTNPLTYLPWIKAFESFPGIQPADYRISVPDHLKATVIP